MRLRSLLAATAAGTTLLVGMPGTAALADTPPDGDLAGTLVSWGNRTDTSSSAALAVPEDLSTALVASVATDDRATAIATWDGDLRVWGAAGAHEVATAPTDVTGAFGVAISHDGGLVLHKQDQPSGPSYTVTGWGSAALEDAPGGTVEAIALGGSGTAYAVTVNGTLLQWGADPDAGPMPASGLTNLVDVSANAHQVLTLRKDGTVVAWSDPAYPELGSVPDFGGKSVTQIATGPTANGVVLSDGSIRLWGPSVPAGQPDFGGKKVVSLSIGLDNAGAITDDGVVHVWGADADVNAVPSTLTGLPASTIAMGKEHAAVIVTFRELFQSTVSGTPEVGQTLTATPAPFALTPATGQWYAGVDPIDGQTGTTLKVDGSLVGAWISYHSTATRGRAMLTSKSDPIGPVTTARSRTTLTVKPGRTAAGNTTVATATVSRLGGTARGKVTFRVDNRSRTVAMDSGKATWRLPVLTTGSQKVTATYLGSPSTAPSTAAPVTIKVTKAASKVHAKGKRHGSTTELTIRVSTSKLLSAKGKVKITLKGKTRKKVTAKVNAAGKATVIVKGLKHGKYKATVKYSGNKSVKASKTTKKFKA